MGKSGLLILLIFSVVYCRLSESREIVSTTIAPPTTDDVEEEAIVEDADVDENEESPFPFQDEIEENGEDPMDQIEMPMSQEEMMIEEENGEGDLEKVEEEEEEEGDERMGTASILLTAATLKAGHVLPQEVIDRGIKATSDVVQAGAQSISPLVQLGSQVIKPHSQLIQQGAEFLAPSISAASSAARPFVKIGNRLAKPFVEAGQVLTEPFNNLDDSLEEALSPLSDAVDPQVTKAFRPLHDAAAPLTSLTGDERLSFESLGEDIDDAIEETGDFILHSANAAGHVVAGKKILKTLPITLPKLKGLKVLRKAKAAPAVVIRSADLLATENISTPPPPPPTPTVVSNDDDQIDTVPNIDETLDDTEMELDEDAPDFEDAFGDGFELVGDIGASGVAAAAGIAGIKSKLAAPFVNLGVRTTAPFVKAGAKLAAPFVKAGAEFAAPTVQLGATLAAPITVAGQTMAEPIVDFVSDNQIIQELTEPLSPSSDAIQDSIDSLVDAVEPVVSAASEGTNSVNLDHFHTSFDLALNEASNAFLKIKKLGKLLGKVVVKAPITKKLKHLSVKSGKVLQSGLGVVANVHHMIDSISFNSEFSTKFAASKEPGSGLDVDFSVDTNGDFNPNNPDQMEDRQGRDEQGVFQIVNRQNTFSNDDQPLFDPHDHPLFDALVTQGNEHHEEENHDAAHGFQYKGKLGPQFWGAKISSTCGGFKQSPINIDEELAKTVRTNPLRMLNYNKDIALTFSKNSHTIVAKPRDDENIIITGGALKKNVYKFVQLHFHWGSTNCEGSEHTLNERRFPLEVHLVHMNTKYSSFDEALENSDGLAVIGQFFGISGRGEFPLSDMDSVLKKFRLFGGAEPVINMRLGDMIESSRGGTKLNSYYSYSGSLTTPGCQEVVSWIVIKNVKNVSTRTMSLIRRLDFEGVENFHNFRPTQKLENRKLSFYA